MRIIAVILFCVLPLVGFPQAVGHLTSYTKDNGPSHRTVSSITKDKDGFLWLGTWNGLNRYDGTSFRTFDIFREKENNLSLQRRRIIQIVDDNDYLWVLTHDKQIYWFNKETERFRALSPLITESLGKTYLFHKIFLLTADHIWLGTEEKGIIAVPRKDRLAQVLHYSTKSSAPYRLSSDTIHIIHKDETDFLWIGTNKGLDLLQPVDKGYHSIGNKYAGGPVIKSSKGKWGSAFIANNADILLVKSGQRQVEKIEIGKGMLQALLFSHLSDILYATRHDGTLFNIPLATKIVKKLAESDRALYNMFEDSKGNLWVEQERSVLYLDRSTNLSRVFKPLYAEKTTKTPFFCFEDINDRVWVSFQGGGLGYFDEDSHEINFSMSDIGSQTTTLPQYNNLFFHDNRGAIWFTSEEKGFVKLVFSDVTFQHHDLFIDKHNFLNDEVRSLMLDATKNLWVGTKAGNLYVRADGKTALSPFYQPIFKESEGIYSLLEDQGGNIWIGTKALGLFKATLKKDGQYTLNRFTPEKSEFDAKQIYALVQDRKQHIWIGTFDNGLYKLEQGFGKAELKKINWTNTTAKDKHFNEIRHITFDLRGNLWVATTEGLVIHAPDGETRFFFDTPHQPVKLGDNDIQYIFSDAKGAMYLCTSGGGLTKVEGNPFKELTFINFGKQDGLYNSFILGGMGDPEGNLWLSTEGGLIKYDKKRKRFTNMDPANRLNNLSFSEKTVCGTTENHLFFGTNKGFLEINPKKTQANVKTATIVLTGLWINNEERNLIRQKEKINIQYIDTLMLSYDENNISIDFALTDFRLSKHNFSYRLLGLDSTWQQNGSLNRATFTTVKPGHYVFEVKGEYTPYIGETFRSLPIIISPPWWATWWAYCLYFCITVIVLIFVRYFVKSMWILKQRIIIEQKMAEVKMRFFTNISHELRTPLTLILSPVKYLLDNKRLSHQDEQYMNMVYRNATRMKSFVDQLLDLRKIQENKFQLQLETFDLNALCKQVMDNFQPTAEERRMTLKASFPAHIIRIQADENHIETILFNILSNAFKYSPDGTEIILTLSEDEKEEMVYLQVADQGPGVANDTLNTIFELFHVEGKVTAANSKGTGVGLALTKELVHMHGGQIKAFNNTGQGLSVVVSLPAVQKHASPLTATEVSVSRIQKSQDVLNEDEPVQDIERLVVLIVEDNADLRDFLKMQLSIHYTVLTADDGLAGLAIAEKQIPDLIISDITMPRMDGITMLKKIRQNAKTSHIPTVLLSAKHAIESQIEGMQYGADLYITKPFYINFLLSSVNNLIRRRIQFFSNLVERREFVLKPSDLIITDTDEDFLKKVVEVVEERMADPEFNIDMVAEGLHMSRNTFYKKFKSLTKLTPIEFVRSMRLQRAEQVLEGGQHTVAEVAYMVGFSSPKYFSTCFKEKFGVSPKQFSQNR